MLPQKFQFACTLTFGDIYLQVLGWLGIIVLSVAATLASMGSQSPQLSFFLVGLILVMSLPFLLFAFVTTLFNHIEVRAVTETQNERASAIAPSGMVTNR